jgi:uncharacterized protein (DUF1015 family)
MALVKPFKGIRFNPEKVDIPHAVTPPYDVISPEDQEEYYSKSEYNAVRLVLGKQSGDDTVDNNRYTRAQGYLESWLAQRILIQDEKDSVYVYEQHFHNKTRRGFIALMKLADFSEGIVIPHERTLSGPKLDRLELMKATGANFGLIFLLYSDPERRIDRLLENCTKGSPLLDFEFNDRIRNRLWSANENADIQRIQKVMKGKTVYIADGHHRYETRLAYRNEAGARREHRANYGMMAFFNMDDPGLEIYPTHRLIHGLERFDSSALVHKLKDFFEVETVQGQGEFLSTLKSGGKHCLGLYWPSNYVILSLKDEALAIRSGDSSRSADWNLLDVSILHSLILEKLLAIDKIEAHVRFTRKDDEALNRVDAGEYQCAFLLNATSVDEFKTIASHRERMPQKSTYFYPKLMSGLIIYKFG